MKSILIWAWITRKESCLQLVTKCSRLLLLSLTLVNLLLRENRYFAFHQNLQRSHILQIISLVGFQKNYWVVERACTRLQYCIGRRVFGKILLFFFERCALSTDSLSLYYYMIDASYFWQRLYGCR